MTTGCHSQTKMPVAEQVLAASYPFREDGAGVNRDREIRERYGFFAEVLHAFSLHIGEYIAAACTPRLGDKKLLVTEAQSRI